MRSTQYNKLQQSDSNIALDSRNDPNVRLEIQLDMNLQTSFHILVFIVETKARIGILVFRRIVARTKAFWALRQASERIAHVTAISRSVTERVVDGASVTSAQNILRGVFIALFRLVCHLCGVVILRCGGCLRGRMGFL